MWRGSKQLLVSSSSIQDIQLKNPPLTKIETLNPKSKDKNNINQWRLKLTFIKCSNVIKDFWAIKEVNATSAKQQASAKYQNKPRIKPKGDCSSSALTEIDNLNPKSKEKKMEINGGWSLPLLGATTL